MRAVIAGLTMALCCYSAAASDLEACRQVSEAAERLACYDAIPLDQHAPAMTFEGNGMARLKPFDVAGPWTLAWEGGGGYFAAMITREGDPMPDVVQSQATAGESYIPQGGRFTLEVSAMGSWSITVRPE